MNENTEPLCDRISRIAGDLENAADDLRGLSGVSHLRTALPNAVAALRHIAELVLEQGVELDELRAEHTALGRAEHQWRIVTPNGPTYSFTQRDLDDHANWLPGVRLEQRTVYGTPWEPADPQQTKPTDQHAGDAR